MGRQRLSLIGGRVWCIDVRGLLATSADTLRREAGGEEGAVEPWERPGINCMHGNGRASIGALRAAWSGACIGVWRARATMAPLLGTWV